jgi:predicted MPP superfamily phosphohydrolase
MRISKLIAKVLTLSIIILPQWLFAENNNSTWTVVLIPDTQGYVLRRHNYPIFKEITDWIKENKDKENIKLVLHLGDLTSNNIRSQWKVAYDSMSILNGVLPYVMCLGNHDLGPNGSSNTRETLFNQYFKIDDNVKNKEMLIEEFEKGKLNNACFKFSQAGKKYLILALEFGPRDKVLEWANKIIDKHP